jgi:uncharacterized DUF497 family protein
MDTQYVWDPKKAALNLRKHGVSFEQAREAFDDPFRIVLDNCDVDGEQRLMLIGMTGKLLLLATVFVEFGDEPGQYSIRIVSARKAVAYEKNLYQENQEGH